ncbi:phage tail assembly chaperone [Novosphingobium sp. SL115]|uniref:phage tail assembly chaperone n=1 Tax=Novosphingobium sp. SL115 TaxID=2995150 RepID=UPI0022769201|nr:phage tail assembly chaperone [Novosphingobium sp. SL115]MCY1670801.1 phage tail assembly chaperone [Novosphingobium sp. SL115]
MSGRIGTAAARLSGQAALLLGWMPDTFWAATPEELATVLSAMRQGDSESIDRSTIDRMMEQDRGG